MKLVDWTGWDAQRIDDFGPGWRVLARRDFGLRGVGHAMTAPPRRGALTAKFALGGGELYRVGGAPLVADDDGWLAIGDGELYASHIPRGAPVATVAVFFAAETIAAARAPELLDGEPAAIDEPLPLGRRRLPYDGDLARAAAAVALDADAEALDELHALALDRILAAADRARAERARLPCVRAATRAELHRRLARAYDHLMSACAGPLDLAALARIAAMAPHHFLHRFRDAFGVTPHRALTARRIERARSLLATAMPIAEIATAVGFATPAAFSTRFHRETGLSPRGYRTARFARSSKSTGGRAR